MSNFITAQFVLLSDLALSTTGELVQVKDNNQVFDHLVHIRWVSGPKEGQEGMLLCSHYCKWPTELMEKADFIEGCFTPASFKNDNRLVLGYHPGSVTSWDEETCTIKTDISIGAGGESWFSRTFQRSWAIGNNPIEEVAPFNRRLLALWRYSQRNAREGMSNEELYDALEQRFLEGVIPLSYQVWSYMLYILNETGINISVSGNGRLSIELPEYGDWCEVHNNQVIVVRDNVEGGFQKAQSFPYVEYTTHIEVNQDYPECGWQKAQELPFVNGKVSYDIPEGGYGKAIEIIFLNGNTLYDSKELGFGIAVKLLPQEVLILLLSIIPQGSFVTAACLNNQRGDACTEMPNGREINWVYTGGKWYEDDRWDDDNG